MKKIIILTLCVLFAIGAMAQNKKAVQKNFVSMEVDDFEEEIHHRNIVIIDLRSPQDFKTSHIDGAINIEWNNSFDYNFYKAKIKKEAKIALYCHSGKRSKLAAAHLAKKGYRVVELNPGIMGWNKANKLMVHAW